MPDILNDSMTQLVLSAAVQLLLAPILVSIFKRMLGEKFDTINAKREEAKREIDEREKAVSEWREAVTGGLRSILRAELVSEHRKAQSQGYCDLETKEYIERTYHAYHKLGGNGIGTHLYDEIVSLPSKPRHHEHEEHVDG
jgi:hypothetical protein